MSAISKTTATTATKSSNNANTTATTASSTATTIPNNNSSSNNSSGIHTSVRSKISTPTNSNNNTATINTSTANTFSCTKTAEATPAAPPLSLFDQLKNSANLNNIKCSNINSLFNSSKFKTQKNLTDWRRFAEDDSSNNSDSSSSSSSSSSGVSDVGLSRGFGAHIRLSENSIKDSFQQKFVASVLGNSSENLKSTKKDSPQLVAVKLSNATISSQNSASKMNTKEVEDASPATKPLAGATIVADKQESEACSHILDLTLQPAKRNVSLRAPAIATKINAEAETKTSKPTPVDITKKATAATVVDKTNSNTSIKGNNNSNGGNVVAQVDSKLSSTTANASNVVNQPVQGERESVSKNVNSTGSSNSNSNNSLGHSSTNCVSTSLTSASQQQQTQQEQEQLQKQIKFSMPTLPPPSASTAVASATRSAMDNKNKPLTVGGCVGIVRGTKRAAGAAALATTSEAGETATSMLNHFTTPASVAPIAAHYFAQNKRQKQGTPTAATAATTAAHFSTGLLNDQQQKQYMENLKALLDSDKLNSVYAHHQNGNDLKAVVYSALTSALCGGNSATATAASKLLAAANQAKKKRKKKRCTDRCDSSESSDR
ncbi:putative uncharacterized protein DDB_G0285119 [Anastrepha obliqua]|uniref:putative uncharacterized protein DDB_G0285119 n=1 Tax=Anastrepha obliqua TaxID=95512 RepID=UPI00240A0F14|nr:putative uncharacterized protein DDB_G0285119 [Anastrepha obliqua]